MYARLLISEFIYNADLIFTVVYYFVHQKTGRT
jgi:hypothetical protein